MTRLRAGAATDVGRVRTVNQDCFLVTDGLWAVADGMGGHAAGDVAARVAIETLQGQFDAAAGNPGLVEAIEAANRAVLDQARADARLRGMGTTLTAVADVSAAAGDDELVVANIGDSRAYLMQNSELSQLTADHSLVEELVRAGELTPREALGHPQRHIVTRALGIDSDIEVDTWTLAPHPGDRFLVCSDGLSNEVDDEHIGQVLREEPDPQAAADRLVEMARANGGMDNITAIVLDVLDDGEAAPSSATIAAALAPSPGPADSADPLTMAVPVVRPEPRPAPPPASAPIAAPRTGPARRHRRITFRVVAFVIALLAVLAGAAAAVIWYARSTYYVGLQGGQLVIYQGRPGGMLGLNPTLKERTGVALTQVPAADVSALQKGVVEASLVDARRYVGNLQSQFQAAQNLQAGVGTYGAGQSGPGSGTGSATSSTTGSTTTSSTAPVVAP